MKTKIILAVSLLAGLTSCTKTEEINPTKTTSTNQTGVQWVYPMNEITAGSEWSDFTHIGTFEQNGYDLFAIDTNATLEINLPQSTAMQYAFELSLWNGKTATVEVLNSTGQIVHSRTYTEADNGHNVWDNLLTVNAPNMAKLRLRFANGGYVTYAYILAN